MSVAGGGGIFVSYRRQDSQDFAGRLYDRLAERFGEDQVFMDVDTIEPGADFAEAINRAVAACTVLLVVIGPNWLTATDERGRRRLDDPDDFIRLEIEAALARDVRVIPVLAQGAIIPGREDLPESLVGLVRRNALFIRHESFRSDAGRLVTAIERVLAAPSPAPVSSVPAAHGVRSAGNAAGETSHAGTGPARNGLARVARVLTDAEPIARSLTNGMGGKTRGVWPVVAVVAIAAGIFGLLLVVYRPPHRSDLEAFVVVAVPVAAAGLMALAWRLRAAQHGGTVGVAELDHLADLLAGAVKDQWARAAGERGLLEPEPIPVRWDRSFLPVAGPGSAAVSSTRFPPLPGLRAVGWQRLRAGQIRDLHAVYGGLGSGRLVITGAPGSGKSGAAVLLVLAALRHREQLPEEDRLQVPVPVMFTLHGWDPVRQQVQDWLAVRLSQTYSLLTGKGGVVKAAGLLAAGRLAVILDGLDEIPEQLRPVALRALSQQAMFRAVVLTRSAEMAAAAAQGLLEGAAAVELQDIDPVTAAGYLTRVQLDPAPRGWRELTGRIRHQPDSPLARALNSPLTLTLVRDTYRSGDDIRELLDFCDGADRVVSRDDIIDYLLDRVLPAAYAQRPGESPPRYDLQDAQNAMRHVAVRMNQDGTRDLQWWSIREWAPAAPRIIATSIAVGLTAGLAVGLSLGLLFPVLGIGTPPITFELVEGLGCGLGVGLAFGLTVGFAQAFFRPGAGNARHLHSLTSWRRNPRAYALGFGFAAGLAAFFTYGLMTVVRHKAQYMFVPGLAFGLMAGLGTAFRGGSPERIAPVRWRQVFRPSSLAAGLVVGLAAGLGFWLATSREYGLTIPLPAGIAAGAAVVIAGAFSRPAADNASPLSPLRSWRSDRAHGLVVGLVAGLAVGLGFGLPVRLTLGPQSGLGAGIWIGVAFGLTVGLTIGLTNPKTWSASLTFAQLAARWHTPVRLMRFLEDARDRNVLRTVGPIYQFRHARLQDRLAEQATATKPNVSRPASLGDIKA